MTAGTGGDWRSPPISRRTEPPGGRHTNLLMAASLMSIAPLIVLFIVLQKHLVKGIQMGAVKG